jgi:hypothetical protein
LIATDLTELGKNMKKCKQIQTPDIIFSRNLLYKMYIYKTQMGKESFNNKNRPIKRGIETRLLYFVFT